MKTSKQFEPSISLRGPKQEVGWRRVFGSGAPDRRRSHRRRVLKSALIVFNKGHCTLGCQILDVSDTGALVMPADMFLCPRDEFVLKPRVGSSRDCEVVWRKMDKVGVRFI
jgi:PilZ domain